MAIGILYWPFEALVHTVFFNGGGFSNTFFEPGLNEAWMRTIIALLFIFFGMYIYRMLKQQDEYIQQLEMLKRALDQAGEGVLITDEHGVIEYVNKSFHRTTGYSSAEALGKNPNILQSGKQNPKFYKNMWSTIKEKGEWSGRIWNRKKSGDCYPEQLHICTVRDNENNIQHYVAIFYDATEQIRMEAQVLQSQKLEAVGTLVGGIAHDFNNILTSMTGNLFLVKMELENLPLDQSEDLQKKLDLVENEGFRAASLIQHLLAFARKGVAQKHPFDLNETIRDIIILTRPSVSKSIEMELELCEESMSVFGDANQLKEIVLNLVTNAATAVKGIDNPRITVHLECAQPLPELVAQSGVDSLFTRLTIQDNGCGIAEENITHIFEPYFTTSDVGEGSGLGLAMVYGAVQMHKGFIDIQSTEQGTSFSIYLPLHQSEAEESRHPDDESIQKKAIVLLENDMQLRAILSQQLQSLNCEVLLVTDTDELVRCLDDALIQVIMIDVDDCKEHSKLLTLLSKIRDIKAKTPIIILNEDEHLQLKIGFSHVLKKPVTMDALKHVLIALNDA